MLLFAPAGAPLSTPKPGGTKLGIQQTADLGLDALEVEFVHGVRMKEQLAKECLELAQNLKISLSIHAPYYINLCSDDELKLKNSRRHILESVHIGHYLKASPVVIHSGFYQGRNSKECEKRAIKQFDKIYESMDENSYLDIKLGPELTGKKSAYGNLEEIINLCEHYGLDRMIPVIDFAHYHARIKRLKSEDDYSKILDYAEKRLGSDYTKNFHCHFSGIEFSDKGERNHLPISSNSPPFKPLLKLLNERGYEGTLVCESPLIEKDALLLKKEYKKQK
jgi:deoxyribonuclease IV